MIESAFDFNEKNWLSFKKELKKIVGNTAYNNWLKQLNFFSIEDKTVSLSVPTKFLRDWIVNNYADKIKSQLKKIDKSFEILQIVVKPQGGRIVPGTARIVKNDERFNSNFDIRKSKISTNEFGAPLDTRFTFENFVVGKPNELAFAAAARIAEAENVTFNPLFL